MENDSQNVILVLNALATTVDQLQSFGYKLYLQTKAASWSQRRSVVVSGQGFIWYERRFDRGLSLGFGLQADATGNRSIIFSIVFAWDSARWFVQSCVEDEDATRENMTEDLWLSREYFATTADKAVDSLQQALFDLMKSVADERVAAILARVEPRR